MANRKKRSTKKPVWLSLLIFAAALIYYFFLGGAEQLGGSSFVAEEGSNPPINQNTLLVDFLDVGQGDSILIRYGSKCILVDASTREWGEEVTRQLSSRGIIEITAVIATHPHSDHIGGLSEVINSFAVKSVYMPGTAHTTRDYSNLLDAIEARQAEIIVPEPLDVLDLGGGVSITFLSPASDNEYDDLNNVSIVARLDSPWGSVMLTGDAETPVEETLLQDARTTRLLDCDVLKAGHHGSSTSTSEDFLTAVSPDYAIISCAVGNDYGHPHRETVAILEEYGVEMLRTDISGTISFIFNESGISFKLEK